MGLWERILLTLGLLEEEEEEGTVPDRPKTERKKIWNKDNVVAFPSGESNYRLVVVSPQSFSEAEEIAAHLKNGRPVVVNLESMETGEAKQTVNFLSGVVFALNGSSQKISQGIFVFAPSGVMLSSDQMKSELKEEGLLFKDEE